MGVEIRRETHKITKNNPMEQTQKSTPCYKRPYPLHAACGVLRCTMRSAEKWLFLKMPRADLNGLMRSPPIQTDTNNNRNRPVEVGHNDTHTQQRDAGMIGEAAILLRLVTPMFCSLLCSLSAPLPHSLCALSLLRLCSPRLVCLYPPPPLSLFFY